MALGLVLLERNEIPLEKLRVDLAFEHAWRDWPAHYKSQFSQVNTDLQNGTDAVWVMTHADEGKRTHVFFWDRQGRSLSIYGRRHDWHGGDPADVAYAVNVIDGTVPIEGWLQLARDFLTDLER